VRLVDTHCHLDFEPYREDLPAVLSRARKAGVSQIMIPGLNVSSSRRAAALADQEPLLFSAAGVHPNSLEDWDPAAAAELREIARQPRVRAVGEIGLDYYRGGGTRRIQQRALWTQLELAAELDLPVILHVRNAGEADRSCIMDLITIVEEWTEALSPDRRSGQGVPPGVVHSFSGNLAEAHRLLELGFYLGITGPVTYPNASGLREVVREIPLSRLLIETDGPYLTPQPRRGRRNEPAYVKWVAEKIAEVKVCSPEETASRTAENADRLFDWR
jgi:TatD DNase family protein